MTEPAQDQTVDRWIVVGAGSGGAVAAARLSESQARHVTLIDDGPDLIEGQVPTAIDGPNFLAALNEPGRTHLGLVASRSTGGPATPYLRGRGVGGSSAVNAMVGLRGDAVMYRSWGWADTDEAWSRVQIPTEVPGETELGPIDRALLRSEPDAEIAALTRRSGRRITSAEAYLWPARSRQNLIIRPDSAVDVVVFESRRAVGVRLVDGTELAADHIVIAAGAIHTPAILLRSGVDTPGVGEHLQDHPSAPLTLQLRADVPQDRSGLALGSLVQRNGLQLLPMNHLGGDDSVAGLAMLMVALMRPHGRAGRVSLDGENRPSIDFALLLDERDVAALATGVRSAIGTLHHDGFSDIVDRVYIDEFGSTVAALADDAALINWLRSHCGDYVHASSSCAMGRVVDHSGAVAGYDSLYLCDASVFPSIPDVNTHLPTTMLAERLSAGWTAGRDRMAT